MGNALKRIAVNIATRDRPSELALLLQSLRTQTVQDFDIFILEDNSGTPLQSYHFINCLLVALKLEGHFIDIERTLFNYGVSKVRQTLADKSLQYDYILRVDDDVILEPDFIEKLLKVIASGYDLASGVTPPMTGPSFTRDTDFVLPIIGECALDKDGNIILNSDDCGMNYTNEAIIPTHHFRSSALYKSEIHKKVNYMPTRFTKHGFREEQLFSFKCLVNGYKLGVNTHAIAWHLMTPSGGERFAESNEMIRFNEQVLKEETKKLFNEYGDFIKDYNIKILGDSLDKKLPPLLNKQTNLIL